MSTESAPDSSTDHDHTPDECDVCGALGCRSTTDVKLVNTSNYGQLALCRPHRKEILKVSS